VVKKVNWLEQIGKGHKHKTTYIKCFRYILVMGLKKRYLMKPLVVEI
jgi:hypothetical protein